MLRVAADTESAYWRLVLARHRVLIQTRLLEVTIADRNLIRERLDIDATQVDLAEANSFVESRRADLIRLQNEVRLASDALKQLIQAEELPVAGEDLILPLDGPYDLPIQFNLLDAVTTALRHRPELQRALLDIKDASIRQRVADNQRLPDLNLTATIRINGIGETTVGQAYEPVTDADFIDYIIGIQFEVPVGNRQREAALQQRKLESQASVINYQRTARDVVLSVKDALRNVINAYSELGARRGARLAAAENLRGIRAQIEAGNPLTPPFIDLKLRREEALAQAETQEIVALVDYNNAIARFYQAMGTLLDRNGIGFNDPLAEMADETWR
jgi:outer membrane protein TolC